MLTCPDAGGVGADRRQRGRTRSRVFQGPRVQRQGRRGGAPTGELQCPIWVGAVEARPAGVAAASTLIASCPQVRKNQPAAGRWACMSVQCAVPSMMS